MGARFPEEERIRVSMDYVANNKYILLATTSLLPDSESDTCKLCETESTFTNRRHHCRACGVLVCNACSGFKLPLCTEMADKNDERTRLPAYIHNVKKPPQQLRVCGKCFGDKCRLKAPWPRYINLERYRDRFLKQFGWALENVDPNLIFARKLARKKTTLENRLNTLIKARSKEHFNSLHNQISAFLESLVRQGLLQRTGRCIHKRT